MHFCQSALALASSIGSAKRQAQVLHHMAWVKRSSGDFSGAKRDSSESQSAARIAGNLSIEASALRIEAVCWKYLGRYNYCLSLLDRATHLLDLCGLAGCSLHNGIKNSQAEVHRSKSEYMEARKIQTHVLRNISADQYPYHHVLALVNIVQIDIEVGGSQHDMQQNISTAGMLFQRTNYSLGITYCNMLRAALDVQLGKLRAARSLFQQCLKSTWGKDTDGVTYCLEKLASIQEWCAADPISYPWPVILLAHSIKFKQRLEFHKALQFLAVVFQAQRDQETATSLFTVALDGFTQMDVHRSRAECMVRLGDISKVNGDELKAAGLWDKARPLFEQSSQTKQLAELNSKLVILSQNLSQEV
jgi:tetratricopeptide (TPR) repeat protein